MGKSKDNSQQPKAAAHKKLRQTVADNPLSIEPNQTNLGVEKRRGVPQASTSKNMKLKPQSSQKVAKGKAAAGPPAAAPGAAPAKARQTPQQKASPTLISPAAQTVTNQTVSNRTAAKPPVNKSTGATRRKQKAPLLREIQRLGASSVLQIPKAPFYRLVQEILEGSGASSQLRMTSESLEVLRESSEIFLPQMFSDAYRITLNREKITLLPRDIQLLMYLRGPNGTGGN